MSALSTPPGSALADVFLVRRFHPHFLLFSLTLAIPITFMRAFASISPSTLRALCVCASSACPRARDKQHFTRQQRRRRHNNNNYNAIYKNGRMERAVNERSSAGSERPQWAAARSRRGLSSWWGGGGPRGTLSGSGAVSRPCSWGASWRPRGESWTANGALTGCCRHRLRRRIRRLIQPAISTKMFQKRVFWT